MPVGRACPRFEAFGDPVRTSLEMARAMRGSGVLLCTDTVLAMRGGRGGGKLEGAFSEGGVRLEKERTREECLSDKARTWFSASPEPRAFDHQSAEPPPERVPEADPSGEDTRHPGTQEAALCREGQHLPKTGGAMDGRYSLDVLDVGANGDLIDVGANGIELATLTLEHGPLFRVPSLVFEPLFRCPTGPVRLPSLPSNDDSDEAREIREEFLHGNFGFSTDLDKTGFYKLSIPRGVHLSSEEMVAFNRVTLAFQQPCLNASFMEYHYKTSHHATKLLLAVKLFVLWSLFFADLARFGTQTPDTAHAVTAG
ncbi:hypothetical protein T484DRAFT_1905236 [Baffinella frigidus]|nr:hypothetical protein T484DRAFT_1905236 [Cryptophyta sp. CCMP2293]